MGCACKASLLMFVVVGILGDDDADDESMSMIVELSVTALVVVVGVGGELFVCWLAKNC